MGKKIRKCIGALLMAVAIAITQIPVSDVEAVDTDTASSSDFQMNGTTLIKYSGTAENVSISNYVEKIEADAFAGNAYLKNIIIGENVTSIGSGAFRGCPQLQSVTIPDSVETIEQAAFADCPSLTGVKVGSGLKSLGNAVFAGDISLSNVEFSSGNPNFTCENGAIYNKEGWSTLYAVLSGRPGTAYTMPATITKVSPYAFWGDKNLQSVDISGSVSEISAYAFSNCCNLTNVTIPYSVNTIGLKAFEDCIRLRRIAIPISVSSIHSTAFDGCTKLKIDAAEGSVAKNFADNLVLEDIEVAEYEDTAIDTVNEAITDDDSQEDEPPLEVDYYHEVTHINPLESEEDSSVVGKSRIVGNEAFVFVDNASATVNSGEVDLSQITGIATGETGETIASISGNGGKKGSSFPKYTVVNDSVIADQAYYNDSRSSIEIPDTIIEIGDFAFARSGITEAVLPEGLEKIGYAAFYHCAGLTNVVIPGTVTEIEPSAFDNTPWLQNWKQNGSGDFLVVGDGILLAYRGNSSIVTIPDGVKTIGPGAFADYSGITKAVLPASVEVVGEGAFAGCSALSEIEGGSMVRCIKDRAYLGCPLQTIRIPASVEEIGLRAFDVADSVKEAGNGIVIFEGTSLPRLSYEASSGKIYNEEYRDLAFNGIKVAVVPDSAVSFTDTVLDASVLGFRGIICNEAMQDGAKVLSIRKMLNNGESLVYYPDMVTVGGRDYKIDKVRIPAEGSEGVAVAASQPGVTVRVSSNVIENAGLANAVLDGAEKGYILEIVDSAGGKSAITDAYREIYGNKSPSHLCAFEITLCEADTLVPITGLGRQSMEISIPMPNGVSEENLHVVCLDANGQLEEVPSRLTSTEGMNSVSFTASHFSSYGIYNYVSGDTAVVNNGQAVFNSLSIGNKDASPDTGDYSIHPKWFLCIGLLFTGLALFFYNGRRKRIY
ncbi:MAG: leucine-rich repeat domain-containing protein [Roseburia sp.]|nr:leucine-rich repeat domain-containing protein [Roseburia sp.]MCM1241951.1 leucine-rich repeat domain-containing protein [Roseburia sp.]